MRMVVSHLGDTKQMAKIAKIMKSRGVIVLTIIGKKLSEVTILSDLVLFAPLSELLKR